MELSIDIWRYISKWLPDYGRYHLMTTNTEMMKLDLSFDESHDYKKIYVSKFFHNFIIISRILTQMI